MAEAKPFKHGPNLSNSEKYDVAGYTLSELESIELAMTILGHFKPRNINPTTHKQRLNQGRLLTNNN